MFYRCATDGIRQPVPLENQYAGPTTTPLWIIGGGPSLSQAAVQIAGSAAPRFAMNLAGSGLLRPQFWTSYDPTSRFHRSVYLDSGIVKFVHAGRAMDLVPETTFKVCDCPALFLIDRTGQRGFHDFPGQAAAPITDWQDSLIQTIDIAFRLGFRELYLAGCEMWIAPSRELQKAAAERGVTYSPRELLSGYIQRCEQSGLERSRIEALSTASQYHFEEQKSLLAAIQADAHYFRVAQTLRLCRRAMALAGLQLVSVTPRSRLNDDFPYIPVVRACRRIQSLTGDLQAELTSGRYSQAQDRRPPGLGPMRDVRPHFWPQGKTPTQPQPARRDSDNASPEPREQLRAALEDLPEIAIDLREQG